MSLSKKRHARKNTRQTLSGRLVPADAPEPVFWPQLVAESLEAFGEKFGKNYPQAKVEPRPTEYAVAVEGKQYFSARGPIAVGEPVEHSGLNRAAKRDRLKKVPGGSELLGSYTKVLHKQLGDAWADNLEARRLMRERNAQARLEAKYAIAAAAV